jgi:hypothetical protein
MDTTNKICDLSVELVALIQLSYDKNANKFHAAEQAKQIVNDINILCSQIKESDVVPLQNKIRNHTIWITAGQIAYA